MNRKTNILLTCFPITLQPRLQSQYKIKNYLWTLKIFVNIIQPTKNLTKHFYIHKVEFHCFINGLFSSRHSLKWHAYLTPAPRERYLSCKTCKYRKLGRNYMNSEKPRWNSLISAANIKCPCKSPPQAGVLINRVKQKRPQRNSHSLIRSEKNTPSCTQGSLESNNRSPLQIIKPY